MKTNRLDKPATPPVKNLNKGDPKETAQETIHQVMSKSDARLAKASGASKPAAKPPMQAAKGDDDLMSTPQKKS